MPAFKLQAIAGDAWCKEPSSAPCNTLLQAQYEAACNAQSARSTAAASTAQGQTPTPTPLSDPPEAASALQAHKPPSHSQVQWCRLQQGQPMSQLGRHLHDMCSWQSDSHCQGEFQRQSTQFSSSPWGLLEGVTDGNPDTGTNPNPGTNPNAGTSYEAFQHVDMVVERAVDSWLQPSDTDTQTDCPHPTPLLHSMAGAQPPAHPTSIATPLGSLQNAVNAAGIQHAFAQLQSEWDGDSPATMHSSQTVPSFFEGKADAASNDQQQQQQQQHQHQQQEEACKTTTVDPRLFFWGGPHGHGSNFNLQGPLGQGKAPASYSAGPAPFGRGWVPMPKAPTPNLTTTPTHHPTPGLGSTVYQFKGSSNTSGVHASCTSQVRDSPGGFGGHPPVGTTPPGSSPALNPAMQPCAGGAPPGHALQLSQPQQHQLQLLLTKMKLCMTNNQKLHQLLNTGNLPPVA